MQFFMFMTIVTIIDDNVNHHCAFVVLFSFSVSFPAPVFYLYLYISFFIAKWNNTTEMNKSADPACEILRGQSLILSMSESESVSESESETHSETML